ncbi:hypothetical protein PCE1_002515 [Barthelona sp. PCE]
MSIVGNKRDIHPVQMKISVNEEAKEAHEAIKRKVETRAEIVEKRRRLRSQRQKKKLEDRHKAAEKRRMLLEQEEKKRLMNKHRQMTESGIHKAEKLQKHINQIETENSIISQSFTDDSSVVSVSTIGSRMNNNDNISLAELHNKQTDLEHEFKRIEVKQSIPNTELSFDSFSVITPDTPIAFARPLPTIACTAKMKDRWVEPIPKFEFVADQTANWLDTPEFSVVPPAIPEDIEGGEDMVYKQLFPSVVDHLPYLPSLVDGVFKQGLAALRSKKRRGRKKKPQKNLDLKKPKLVTVEELLAHTLVKYGWEPSFSQPEPIISLKSEAIMPIKRVERVVPNVRRHRETPPAYDDPAESIDLTRKAPEKTVERQVFEPVQQHISAEMTFVFDKFTATLDKMTEVISNSERRSNALDREMTRKMVQQEAQSVVATRLDAVMAQMRTMSTEEERKSERVSIEPEKVRTVPVPEPQKRSTVQFIPSSVKTAVDDSFSAKFASFLNLSPVDVEKQLSTAVRPAQTPRIEPKVTINEIVQPHHVIAVERYPSPQQPQHRGHDVRYSVGTQRTAEDITKEMVEHSIQAEVSLCDAEIQMDKQVASKDVQFEADMTEFGGSPLFKSVGQGTEMTPTVDTLNAVEQSSIQPTATEVRKTLEMKPETAETEVQVTEHRCAETQNAFPRFMGINEESSGFESGELFGVAIEDLKRQLEEDIENYGEFVETGEVLAAPIEPHERDEGLSESGELFG